MEVKEIKKEVTIAFDETEIIALKNICKFYLDNKQIAFIASDEIVQSILNLDV